jgi:putative ABC transport system substrate-binding protein
MMDRRAFLGTLAGGLLAAPLVAEAQQSARIYRLGYLGPGSGSTLPPALDAFRQQLRQLGYVEGQNLTIEYRWAADKDEQLPQLAADLVRLKVDVIVVEGHTPAIQAAKKATSTIPIVMGVSGDPVKMGLVESLARPGGNVTGLSIMTPGLAPKRLPTNVPFSASVRVWLTSPRPSSTARSTAPAEGAARRLASARGCERMATVSDPHFGRIR